MFNLFKLRIAKIWFCLSHPQLWRALRLGVAPSIEHRKFLKQLDCDFIIDVGANRGQFSLISRIVKPKVHIIAFEPIPIEAEVFRKTLSGFQNIQLHQTALGEQTGQAEIHLSRSADSSSLLPISNTQKSLFKNTEEVGTLKVSVKKLDDFQNDWKDYSKILLKIDVQGFELAVLKGAIETLKKCAYVYVECSETELYVGQALYRDVADFLEQQNFNLNSQHNETMVNGKLIQADYLFIKSKS